MSASASHPDGGIAIVGFAGRFPGASDTDELWANLVEGQEAIVALSDADLRARGAPEGLVKSANAVRNIMLLADPDCFDAEFFDYPASQARRMDPQQRIFLEVVWRALEHAGCNIQKRSDGIGVFAGSTPISVGIGDDAATIVQDHIDNGLGSVATRTSYKLDLRGPSLAIQTACSTSLVATHYAVQSLLNFDCEIAVVGGSSITSQFGYVYQTEGLLSPDGRCRAYDADANGTTPGCGACAVVLKRVEDAIGQNDRIYAVIRGTAVNNDGGRKVGYTAPSVEGQIEVIRRALAVADIEPETIGLLEGHGSGTPLGDAIEIAALEEVFQVGGANPKSCVLGSIKANIGHLDVAAGAAGLIKATLCLSRKTLVPSPNIHIPNNMLSDFRSPLYINESTSEWKSSGPRRAGISSFGLGGTNAHVVLEEYRENRGSELHQPQLIVLSAKTADSLRRYAADCRAWLTKNPAARIDDFAFTLQTGRPEFEHRYFCVVSSHAEMTEALDLLFREVGGTLSKISPPEDGMRVGLHFAHCSEFSPDPSAPTNDSIVSWCLIDGCATDVARSIEEEGANWIYGWAELDPCLQQQALYLIHAVSIGRTLLYWGLNPSTISGSGAGLLAAAVLLERLSISEALERVKELGGKSEQESEASLTEFSDVAAGVELDVTPGRARGLEGWSGSIDDRTEATTTILSITPGRYRADAQLPGAQNVTLVGLSGLTREDLLHALGRLWASGAPIAWTNALAGAQSRRIALPGHPLSRQRFSEARPATSADSDGDRLLVETSRGEGPDKTVTDLWREVLKVDSFAEDADFLSLGGDSILAVQLASRIQEFFAVEIPLMLILRTGTTAKALSLAVSEATGEIG